MTNANYNLLKLLYNTLDNLWRLEKYYIKDAEEENCSRCKEMLESLKSEISNHAALLQEELAMHVKEKKFK